MTVGDLVVVGVDGSDASHRALRWALHEAARRGSAVEVVTAWSRPAERAALLPQQAGDELAQLARQRQDKVVAAELSAYEGLLPTVSQEVVEGDPAQVLAHASGRAAFLVVGSRGAGRLHPPLLGSVSEACIRAAVCPVVVIPTPPRTQEGADHAELQVAPTA